MSNGLTGLIQLMGNKGLSAEDVSKMILKEPEEKAALINDRARWHKEIFNEYDKLLQNLETSSLTTKEQGDKLEALVNFLVEKSYYYTVKHNRKTSSNQIDQVIVLSDRGKNFMQEHQADLTNSEIVRHLNLPKIFLGECKNYPNDKIGVSEVGKVYSVMKSLDYRLAIIFSVKGVTGDYEKWTAGKGLIKNLRLMEKYQTSKDYFYIIDFNLKDFKQISNGVNFLEILREKITHLEEGIKIERDLTDGEQKFIEEAKLIKAP